MTITAEVPPGGDDAPSGLRWGTTPEERWKVFEALYPQLRVIAASRAAGQPAGATLQVTALVHEAAMRIFGNDEFEWEGSGQLLQYAATVMRRLLIDHARRRQHDRACRDHCPQIDSDVDRLELALGEDLVALDRALVKLAGFDPVGARLVDLRFFGRVSMVGAAEQLGLSISSAERRWRGARAFLRQELDRDA